VRAFEEFAVAVSTTPSERGEGFRAVCGCGEECCR
jgi:hypothetical protein